MCIRDSILAGGLGTRLRPYTTVIPKPLVPIDDKPILEIVIKELKEHGFEHITLAVNHKADLIKAYFQDGNNLGVKIDYTYEEKKLGTMGPLKLVQDLPENFLIMNGDIITDLNFSEFFASELIFLIISLLTSMIISPFCKLLSTSSTKITLTPLS